MDSSFCLLGSRIQEPVKEGAPPEKRPETNFNS